MCQARAVADGLWAVEHFADPISRRLLTDDELAQVEFLRADRQAETGVERFTAVVLTACAQVIVPRTVIIDQAVTRSLIDSPHMQLAIVGAGLDSRPWRMPELQGVRVYSIDHPASQASLQERAASMTSPDCDLQFVPADLSQQSLSAALADFGFDSTRPTIWVWEGVIPYLDRAEVRAALRDMTALSAAGSRLIAQYQVGSMKLALGRRTMSAAARLARQPRLLADEPWRSTWSPARIGREVAVRGWRVTTDEQLLDCAESIGSPVVNRGSLTSGRVLVADR